MAATFKVTGITRTYNAPPGKLGGPALEVTFETIPSGILGAVILPEDGFSEEAVAAAVTDAAATLERVKNL